MKPNLVIGLGNPLVGDEGIGWHVAERLAGDPRLPEDTEVLWGGTDLLRLTDQMEDRRRVILIDALLDPSEPGNISVFEDGFPGLEDRQEHAHHLSAMQAVRLLKTASPCMDGVRFTLVAIVVDSANIGCELSASLAAKMPQILDRVLQELA